MRPPSYLRRRFLKQSLMAGAGLGLLPGTGAFARPATRKAIPKAAPFDIKFDSGRITSLRHAHDAFDTDYIAPGQSLGHVRLTWRKPDGSWAPVDTHVLPRAPESPGATSLYIDGALRLETTLAVENDDLVWTLDLVNSRTEPLEIGDLALPLPMHTEFKSGQPATAAVLKHSFVSGHGSFMFWMRSNSAGPYLMMTPDADTHLEYWDRQTGHKDSPPVYSAYIHSATAGAIASEKGSHWRQPNTSLVLAPAGQPGDRRRYGFRFTWAENYDDVRDRLVSSALIDIVVAPGMTVPTDLFARIALRTNDVIHGIDAEHPEATLIAPLGIHNGRHIYHVRFARLGENRLSIRHGQDRTTYLEFFATEPIETLIRKRGAFIANHQHRDPAKWYNGLLAEWNMDSRTLLGPDNYDHIKGWRVYEVTCDDPGLSKPAFLATKNALYPVQAEVEALDYYVEHFVWGGLQRTTDETYSYGIYGILDWKQNRTSPDPGPKGQLHIWRAYDYPHIIVMYFGLYRIARDHPDIAMRLSAETYLQRAAGTALALFTVPKATGDWSAYETGFYNEMVIPELIDAMAKAGRTSPSMAEQASQLRGHWEKKVSYFVTGAPDLFGSEYAFDSTGFESTQALARYAIDHTGKISGITRAKAKAFSEKQIAANLFCRGTIEPAYYYLGSDYRGEAGDTFTLTYMAQMGGGAVMDYALHDAADPYPYIRLGYASYLSAWALLNSGTKESGYGYWYPGVENDGGSGGGFEPAAYGFTWLDQPHHRGPWYYSSESDLGYCGALRSAATVLADDPIFGRFCFGGDWTATGDGVAVVPKDGVRQRFHCRLKGEALSLVLRNDRFAAGEAIEVTRSGVRFQIESDNSQAHVTILRVSGLKPGTYQLGSKAILIGTGVSEISLDMAETKQAFTLHRV